MSSAAGTLVHSQNPVSVKAVVAFFLSYEPPGRASAPAMVS
jgi:hypothetical protein